MSALSNFLGYQAVWLVAVAGAGRGLVWPALAALAAFALWQLARSGTRRADLRVLAVAVALGVLLDGALSLCGVLGYAAPRPALPPGGAPLWILALWAAFALTLNHSLAWLRRHSLLAALLGAVGGPFAYLAAAKLANAVTFRAPEAVALAALAAGWGAALVVLVRSASHWSGESGSRVPA